jgi:citrate lyase subunit beta / citryl-CoA lyase
VTHPAEVLFRGLKAPIVLPVCDHYAGNEGLIQKSLALQSKLAKNGIATFDVTADCEDGAPVGAEREHASMVGDLIGSNANEFNRIGIRIHDPAHANWHTDLEVALPRCGDKIAFVTVPKVVNVDELDRVIAAVDDVCFRNGIRREIPIHVLIETHGAMLDVNAIAKRDRVECISFGLLDYISEFNGALPSSAMQSPGQFDNPLVRQAKVNVSMACHSYGKVPSHGVTTNISRPQLAGEDAARASNELGFTRMWSIHPAQIEHIVTALSAEFHEINRACEVLFAAESADWGPVQVAGKLEDRASYRYWWLLLRRAHFAGATLPERAARWFRT